jgi:uncharacterized membrane protein YphA (DoxX/SURF4 family)
MTVENAALPGGRWAQVTARLPWVSLVARLFLGAVWLYYSLPKLTSPEENVAAVRNFEILPASMVSTFAYTQPYLELALGLLLIVGLGTRLVAGLSGLLLLVYIGGIISLGARGIAINCGCGGNGGKVAAGQTRYTLDVLRDIGFLVPALWLLWRPKSLWSADAALLPELPPELVDVRRNGSKPASKTVPRTSQKAAPKSSSRR